MAEFRAAQAADVGAIVVIDPQGPDRREEIRALVRAAGAVEHGQIVGFLGIRPGHFYHRDFVDLLFVAPRGGRAWRVSSWSALGHALTSRVFTSTNQSNAPMRELLRSEGWTASGVLSGLDDGDPEHVFFHDAVPL